MYTYLITTYTTVGEVRATIHFTCDEADKKKAKALVTLDETAKIVAT